MNGMISKIVIIGIIAIIVLAVMKLFGVLPKHRDKKYETRIPDNQDMYRTNPMILNEKKLNETNAMEFWTLKQFDKKGKMVREYRLPEIVEGDKLTLGIDKDNDIVLLTDKENILSRHHAAICKERGYLVLKDTDSRNGVFNEQGKRLTSIPLKDGSIFFLAKSRFELNALNPFNLNGDSMEGKQKAPKGNRVKIKR